MACAGALQDCSALRGHPQAPAMLEQLQQPFNAAAGSSAPKVSSPSPAQVAGASVVGRKGRIQRPAAVPALPCSRHVVGVSQSVVGCANKGNHAGIDAQCGDQQGGVQWWRQGTVRQANLRRALSSAAWFSASCSALGRLPGRGASASWRHLPLMWSALLDDSVHLSLKRGQGITG